MQASLLFAAWLRSVLCTLAAALPSPSCRVAALTLSALLALRAGDASSAALMLTRALKTGHGQLGNTQMVAQVISQSIN